MGCGCGCNGNISYGRNRSCTKQSAGIYFCKDPFCYVKSNFVVPAADVILDIEVTDSSRLYVGQGIKIGTGYFQIVTITDTHNISIAHSGTATPGLQITAIHPTYGCYQYPIIFVGGVWLNWTPTLVGWSTPPPSEIYRYMVLGKTCFLEVFQSGTSVSNSTSTTISLPIDSADISMSLFAPTQFIDNGVTGTGPGVAIINGSSSIVTLGTDWANAGWTASGIKSTRFQASYPIE